MKSITSKKADMKCIRTDCENEAPYFAVLVLPVVKGPKRAHVRMVLEKLVCLQHTEDINVGDYVNGSAWKNIVKGFRQRGLPAPRKQDCHIEFTKAIEKGEATK